MQKTDPNRPFFMFFWPIFWKNFTISPSRIHRIVHMFVWRGWPRRILSHRRSKNIFFIIFWESAKKHEKWPIWIRFFACDSENDPPYVIPLVVMARLLSMARYKSRGCFFLGHIGPYLEWAMMQPIGPSEIIVGHASTQLLCPPVFVRFLAAVEAKIEALDFENRSDCGWDF